jgi:hypothetical protein
MRLGLVSAMIVLWLLSSFVDEVSGQSDQSGSSEVNPNVEPTSQDVSNKQRRNRSTFAKGRAALEAKEMGRRSEGSRASVDS